ncbi:hypothetical protein BCR34DRAFT_484686 [Clohesyomyces aquaticus]|uniref:MULE transposase domain-containing protein n=1 Tax=Clohesyomyces aquaticus TaxID=1231657 RepID=A0A1Y1ZLM4_9PLEO|nr:hypothetical protein BCR34DRAFT_484686 [Clohesyomyces aquaticus]
MPLLHFIGILSLETNFEISYSFIGRESKEFAYVHIKSFCSIYNRYYIYPKVFITNKDSSLKNAI